MGRTDELLARGVPDRRLALVRPRVEAVADTGAGSLPPSQQRALRPSWPTCRRRRRVDACGMPDTLVHGDFHPGNVVGPPEGYVRHRLGRLLRRAPARRRARVHRAARPGGAGHGPWLVPRAWRRIAPGSHPDRRRTCSGLLPPLPAVMYDEFCSRHRTRRAGLPRDRPRADAGAGRRRGFPAGLTGRGQCHAGGGAVHLAARREPGSGRPSRAWVPRLSSDCCPTATTIAPPRSPRRRPLQPHDRNEKSHAPARRGQPHRSQHPRRQSQRGRTPRSHVSPPRARNARCRDCDRPRRSTPLSCVATSPTS